MWYCIWVLEILLACTFSIIIALIFEHIETIKTNKEKPIEKQYED